MTDEELNAIEERAKKATPGPWLLDDTIGADHHVYTRGYTNDWAFDVHGPNAFEDGEFIAGARKDVPALLAEVRRLKSLAADLALPVHDVNGEWPKE